jgi:spermidine synthase
MAPGPGPPVPRAIMADQTNYSVSGDGGVLVKSRAFLLYLLATALICGAMVMVVEILGSRLIGPFFGVSLFVWTALITVTLVALAAGYALGGVLADRRGSPEWLYGIILAAGLLVMAIPSLKFPVLAATSNLGLRFGALVGSLVLFGPALFLLGCVSPYLVRIAGADQPKLGRTVGGLYALSTVGSFIGTLATGFYLIAWIGVERIFVLTGATLILLGAGYFAVFRKRLAPLAALLPVLLLWPAERLPEVALADGTRARLIYNRDSFYGNVKVVEYQGSAIRTRELLIDGQVQGGIDTANGMSVYEYPYLLQHLPLALHPGARNALVIGLGAGVVPRFYASRGIRVDAVDIDPEVARVANTHFGLPDAVNVVIQDARYFLASTSGQYDLMVLDVFSGDTTPGHLLSREAVSLLKQRLAPEGVLSVNMIGSLKQESLMTASVVHTLRQVFDHVQIHPVSPPESGATGDNLVLVAWNGAARTADQELLASLPLHPMAAGAADAYGRIFAFPAGTPAIVLTDDYNPIDFYDVWIKEAARKIIIENTPPEILLSAGRWAAGRA